MRVTDNLSLRSREYLISLKGVEISRYELPQGCELAIPSGQGQKALEGQATRDPAFGMSALWIPSERAERARNSGYTVVDPVSVPGTHLSELIRRHAYELLSRQDTKRLLDRVAVENPKVVEDLVPKLLPLASVQRVLHNLLRERVSIRDAVSILEALGEAAGATRNPVLLTEYVRQALRRSVVKPYVNRIGELPSMVPRSSNRAGDRGGRGARRTEQPPGSGAVYRPAVIFVNRIVSKAGVTRSSHVGYHHHGRALFPAPTHRSGRPQPLLCGPQRSSGGNARAVFGNRGMRIDLQKIPASDDRCSVVQPQ